MRSLLALAALLMGSTAALAEVPRVVASIKPVHALVSAVMGDLGTPELLVKGAASPHAYSLKPSDAAALQQAQIVFWTGHQFEVFLEDALETVAASAQSVTLGEAPGITLLPAREGGMFEAHDHAHEGGHDHDEHDHDHDHEEHDHEAEHDHAHGDDHDGDVAHADEHAHEEGEHEHEHGEMDMHTFLDPENAKAMLGLIEATLAEADPDNAATYAANAAAERQALDALEAEVDTKLAAIKDRPIVVFHDAYQYFGARFGLNIVGSITVSPESMPGADRITQIREKLKTLDAACVFAEPNFDPRIVGVLVEGTEAGVGTLDPEGASLEPGKGLYATLINGLADGLLECLQK